jgi:hypothetical protein
VGRRLERLEWDFETCPGEELGACLDWEYLREIVLLDPEIAQRILHVFIPVELHVPGSVWRRVDGVDDPDFETVKDLSKYFPRHPYLSLPEEYRSRLLSPVASDMRCQNRF